MMSFLSATVLLFLVMDPMGNIPLFLTALKDVDESRRRFVIIRELIIALIVLVVFLFCGRYILAVLQITETALSIAGGIVLFLIATTSKFLPSDLGLSTPEQRQKKRPVLRR